MTPKPDPSDGPTRPSAPTGHTALRDLAWFLARTPPSDGHAPPRTPGDWNRQSIAAFIARHSPEEAPMPEPADRPPSLRERLADALHCPTCGVEPGAHCLRARVDNRQPHMTRVQAADAVLPVVEDAIAQYRMQVDDPDSLLHALAQARDAIADERRGRLAAEAAVRRGRATLNSAKRCQDSLDPTERMQCAMCGGDHLAEALEALDAEQPEPTRRAEPVRWNVCPDCLGRHPDGASCALDAEEPR